MSYTKKQKSLLKVNAIIKKFSGKDDTYLTRKVRRVEMRKGRSK